MKPFVSADRRLILSWFATTSLPTVPCWTHCWQAGFARPFGGCNWGGRFDLLRIEVAVAALLENLDRAVAVLLHHGLRPGRGDVLARRLAVGESLDFWGLSGCSRHGIFFSLHLFDRFDSEVPADFSRQDVIDFPVARNCGTPVAAIISPP